MNVMKKYLIPLVLLFIAGSVKPVFAQFEGEVEYRVINEQTSQPEVTNLNMTFTDGRIFIESSSSLDVMSGLRTDGILVRNDHQDFIFNTGEREAVQIAKSDIDRLVDLLNRASNGSGSRQMESFDWEGGVIETGNTRQLHGFEVKEFVLNSEEENRTVSVWLTAGIKVEWGLLEETWQTTGRKQLQDVPVELFMNRNSFPLLIEGFEDGKRAFKAEAIAVNQTTFDRSKTELPGDVKLLGISELMMNMFRQRR